MQCYVYRSRRKAETYLYVPRKVDFDQVPDALLKVFGKPEFALEFELTSDRGLAVADARQVLHQLSACGFYLQMPTENDTPF